jgi:hypothetical protein
VTVVKGVAQSQGAVDEFLRNFTICSPQCRVLNQAIADLY